MKLVGECLVFIKIVVVVVVVAAVAVAFYLGWDYCDLFWMDDWI